MKDRHGTEDSGLVGRKETEMIPHSSSNSEAATSSNGQQISATSFRTQSGELLHEEQSMRSVECRTRTIATQTDDGYMYEEPDLDPSVAQARERLLETEQKNKKQIVKDLEAQDDRKERERGDDFHLSESSRRQSEGLMHPLSATSHESLVEPSDSWRSNTTNHDMEEEPKSNKMEEGEEGEVVSTEEPPPRLLQARTDGVGQQNAQAASNSDAESQRPGAVAVQGRAFGQFPVWGRHRAAPTTSQDTASTPFRSPTRRGLFGSIRAISRTNVELEGNAGTDSSVPQATQVHDATLIVYPESISTQTDLMRQERARKRRTRFCYGVMAFFVVLALALGFAFGFGVGQQDKNNETENIGIQCDNLVNPSFVLQCQCNDRIENQSDQVMAKFKELQMALDLNATDSLTEACELRNLALWWLANDTVSGNSEDEESGESDEEKRGESEMNSNAIEFCQANPTQLLTQRYVLTLVYFSMNGQKWPRQDFWLSSNSTCDWEGVECSFGNESKTVFSLKLGFQNASGTIPVELGRLCGLRDLDLSHNQLTGTVPDDLLLRLKYLRRIGLERNRLTGAIPDVIRKEDRNKVLETLEKFLSNMKLPEVERVELENLLDRRGPFFSMDFSDNCFNGSIPVGFGLLTSLRHIRVDNNSLEGPPVPPACISLFENIEVASFSKNKLAGTIPTHIGMLTRLEFLDLSQNQMNGTLVSEIGNLEMLTTLRLAFNNFNGTIPNDYTRLQQLVEFDLRSHNLIGPVPDGLCDSLAFLDPGIWVNCNGTLDEQCDCCQCGDWSSSDDSDM